MLVLSQFAEERYAIDLVGDDPSRRRLPAQGPRADFAAFAEAVRRVAAGGAVLDPTVVSSMLGRRRRDDPLEALTPREREVLELMAEGRTNRGIAEVLVVTPPRSRSTSARSSPSSTSPPRRATTGAS